MKGSRITSTALRLWAIIAVLNILQTPKRENVIRNDSNPGHLSAAQVCATAAVSSTTAFRRILERDDRKAVVSQPGE